MLPYAYVWDMKTEGYAATVATYNAVMSGMLASRSRCVCVCVMLATRRSPADLSAAN